MKSTKTPVWTFLYAFIKKQVKRNGKPRISTKKTGKS